MTYPFVPFAIANVFSALNVSRNNMCLNVPPLVTGLTAFWVCLATIFFGLWVLIEGLLIGWFHANLCLYGPDWFSLDIYASPGFLKSFCDQYLNIVVDSS